MIIRPFLFLLISLFTSFIFANNLSVVMLDNGLRIIIYEDHRGDTVKMSLILPAGERTDPYGMEGLSLLTGRLSISGYDGKKKRILYEEIEGRGASLQSQTTVDNTNIIASGKAGDTEFLLRVIANSMEKPILSTDDLMAEMKRVLIEIKLEKKDPYDVGLNSIRKSLFGENLSPSKKSIKKIHPAETKEFIDKYYKPGGSSLLISGNINREEIIAKCREIFKGWQGKSYPGTPLIFKEKEEKTIRIGLSQAFFFIAIPILEEVDDISILKSLSDYIGGMGLASMLNREIRQERGLSYGFHSSLLDTKANHYILLVGSTRIAEEKNTYNIIRNSLESLAKNGLSDEEIDEMIRYEKGIANTILSEEDILFSRFSSFISYGITPEKALTIGNDLEEIPKSQIRDSVKDIFRSNRIHIVIVK